NLVVRVTTAGPPSKSRPAFRPFQWIIIALIEQSNTVCVIARITNLHMDPKQPRGWKLFYCKSNGLSGRRESTITETRPCAARALGEEEFCGSRIIKVLFRAFNLRSYCLMVRAIRAHFILFLFWGTRHPLPLGFALPLRQHLLFIGLAQASSALPASP